ncbi:MAG: type VI secretion system baseplate subunit TssE [Moraxellaceae bacterium]|nr:MAG: type VI secretion system baseplate subunit TssE [Moraxellaceae bacterium]
MHRELSLLDRIEQEIVPGSYTTQFDQDLQLQNVIDNVQRMLNVREGSVLALPDYGMPDFNDVVKEFPDAINRIQQAITRFIETYEPRLQSVYVHYVHDVDQPLLLRFVITGDLRSNGRVSKVTFDTVLTGAGQATVRV